MSRRFLLKRIASGAFQNVLVERYNLHLEDDL